MKTSLVGHPFTTTAYTPIDQKGALYFRISPGPGLDATIFAVSSYEEAVRVLNRVKIGCLQDSLRLSPDSKQNVCLALDEMIYQIQ
ncbi:hypothetical protein [Hymenobacter sp. IS2118]|uniref:hypothetical protein n=1 Tax=Hymenobacter sp. IS2118 TaxID=1505605 RepID=UPI0012697825|nr:hypothetical protein [Hymenobacter sp. IS2118]